MASASARQTTLETHDYVSCRSDPCSLDACGPTRTVPAAGSAPSAVQGGSWVAPQQVRLQGTTPAPGVCGAGADCKDVGVGLSVSVCLDIREPPTLGASRRVRRKLRLRTPSGPARTTSAWTLAPSPAGPEPTAAFRTTSCRCPRGTGGPSGELPQVRDEICAPCGQNTDCAEVGPNDIPAHLQVQADVHRRPLERVQARVRPLTPRVPSPKPARRQSQMCVSLRSVTAGVGERQLQCD